MKYRFLLLFLGLTLLASAQKNAIDKIVAIVGDEIILKSDIEGTLLELKLNNRTLGSDDDRSLILEKILEEKLILAQAKLDSVFVEDDQVERTLNSQLEYFVQQIGSVENLENYFGKPIEEIRSENRPKVRDALIVEKMSGNIFANVRVTPSEVRKFYKQLPTDSLPEEPAKYEVQQIVAKPRVADVEKERLRNRLREFRDQVYSGQEEFRTLAILHSEDQASAIAGGELGYSNRTDFVTEFAEAAFSLKPGRMSKIIETDEGFHLIKFVDRDGDRVNVQQILLRPRIDDEARKEAQERLDSIALYINEGDVTFELAAYHGSDDKETRSNGGLLINQQADNKLSLDQIKSTLMIQQILKLKPGEMSEPFLDNSLNKEEYKIIKLRAFHPAHAANLEEDWPFFEEQLTMRKRQTAMEKWIKERIENTYIHIDDEYQSNYLKENGWVR